MNKILKKPTSKALIYCCVMVSLIILLLISGNNILLAQNWEDEDETKIVAEAQKDLAAILQWSVKYRFSPDLKVGDKVEYQLIGDPENKTDISLEVTKEEKDGVWIVEKFDDNEIHMLIDLKNMELVDFFGYDEDKKIPDPPMLTKKDMEKRIQVLNDFKKGLSIFGIPENWENTRNRENISTKFGNIEKVGDGFKAIGNAIKNRFLKIFNFFKNLVTLNWF